MWGDVMRGETERHAMKEADAARARSFIPDVAYRKTTGRAPAPTRRVLISARGSTLQEEELQTEGEKRCLIASNVGVTLYVTSEGKPRLTITQSSRGSPQEKYAACESVAYEGSINAEGSVWKLKLEVI